MVNFHSTIQSSIIDLANGVPYVRTVACTASAFTVPSKVAAGISIAGAVAGVIALTAPPAWHSYQDYNFDTARANVQQLRCTFQNDIGAVDDKSRDILKPSQFKFLQRAFVNL